MASRRGTLSELQLALATSFFRQTSGFFLTGGAVLAGWELAHRTTDDLDLFTDTDEAMALGDSALRRAVEELEGTLEGITTAPDFRRYVATVKGQSVKVDLVRDRVAQLLPKIEREGVVMDSAQEIFANKICTLVERSEIRDVVDVMMLERTGLTVEASLPLAQRKDSGVTPAVLAWLLATLIIPASVPGTAPREEVVRFVRDLEQRMLRLAPPK